MDTALQCLVLVARQHGVELSVERIKREHAIQEAEVTEGLLTDVSRRVGLDAKSMAISWADLMNAGEALPPCSLQMRCVGCLHRYAFLRHSSSASG